MKKSAKRVAKWRSEKAKTGMVRLCMVSDLWTWPKHVERIKEFVMKLNRGD